MFRQFALAAAALAFAAPAAAQDTHQHQPEAPPAQEEPEHAQQGRAEDGDMQHMEHGEHAGHQDHGATHSMPHSEEHQDHGATHAMPHAEDHQGHAPAAPASAHVMQSGFGPYPMTRDASGTSWQPDAGQHNGVHAQYGNWSLMGHALINGVYDWQDGPRGDEKSFIAGMVMGTARRNFANGDALQFRAMLSPDPFMGKDGYPLLLAAGETADGATPLIDRQHPHDLFMELSASYAHRMSDTDSIFVYAGLPGEPAFGPPAFMHRMSAIDSPEAPITHHWLDSTHITFGVVTAGWVHDNWKFEASRFRGREPDESRYDIETGALDSTSVRLSWNPTRELSLQASWADITSPEGLEPDEDEKRVSFSGIYTRPVGVHGWWSSTLAFAQKENDEGENSDAWLAETAFHPNADWTFFARAEQIESNELTGDHHDPAERVARLSIGAIRDWRLAEHMTFGLGALAQTHRVPDALDAAYGGDPAGAMAFARLKFE